MRGALALSALLHAVGLGLAALAGMLLPAATIPVPVVEVRLVGGAGWPDGEAAGVQPGGRHARREPAEDATSRRRAARRSPVPAPPGRRAPAGRVDPAPAVRRPAAAAPAAGSPGTERLAARPEGPGAERPRRRAGAQAPQAPLDVGAASRLPEPLADASPAASPPVMPPEGDARGEAAPAAVEPVRAARALEPPAAAAGPPEQAPVLPGAGGEAGVAAGVGRDEPEGEGANADAGGGLVPAAPRGRRRGGGVAGGAGGVGGSLRARAGAGGPGGPERGAPEGGHAGEGVALAGVLARLRAATVYPDDAKRRGAEGAVVVRFRLDEAGLVESVELLRSSGDRALDRAALAAVRRGAPYPAAGRTILAPIVFDLEEGRRHGP